MLPQEADHRLGLTGALSACIGDPRDQSQITRQLVTLLSQRFYQIACGYEDCNDADDLRSDWAFKTALGRRPHSDRDLASQPDALWTMRSTCPGTGFSSGWPHPISERCTPSTGRPANGTAGSARSTTRRTPGRIRAAW